MSDHPESRDGFVNPSVKYEHSDLSLRAVLTFAFSLAVVLVLLFVGMWFLVPAYLGPTRSAEPVAAWKFKGEPGPNPNDSHLPAKPELEAIAQNAPPAAAGAASTRTIQEQVTMEEDYLNLSPYEDFASSVGASASLGNGALLGLSRFSARGFGHLPIKAAMRALAGGVR